MLNECLRLLHSMNTLSEVLDSVSFNTIATIGAMIEVSVNLNKKSNSDFIEPLSSPMTSMITAYIHIVKEV